MPPRPPRPLNLAIAFLLEMAVLLAVGYRAFTLPAPLVPRIIVGLGAPVLMALLWGVFASPRARRPLPGAANVAFQVGWFGVGVLVLVLAGHTGPAVGLAAIYLLNSATLRYPRRGH